MTNAQTYTDHAGQTLTVPDVEGLTTASWKDQDGSTILTSPSWRWADGTVFIPADAQAPADNSVADGHAIGHWVEATIGHDACCSLAHPAPSRNPRKAHS